MGQAKSYLCGNQQTNNDQSLGYDSNFDNLYEVGTKLGKGNFAVTHKCVQKKTGKEYAVKIIKKKTILKSKKNKLAFEKEIQILQVLKNNSHVVKLEKVFEDQTSVYVVQQLCTGGELFDVIVERNHISERLAAQYVQQLLVAVAECHLNGIVHRDLKPENFLFEHKGEDAPLLLIDFGLASFFNEGSSLSDPVGTAYYVAPEVLTRKYGPACDVWSIGVIAYNLLSGRYPFWGPRHSQIFTAIRRSSVNFHEKPWPKISSEAKDFIKLCLQKNPNYRITAAQALSHPWIANSHTLPNVPLDFSVLAQLKAYSHYNKLKKIVLRSLAAKVGSRDLRDLRDQFSALDADHTGTISMKEMINATKQLRTGQDQAQVIPEEEVQEIMQGLDDDGDGQIDYFEFLVATIHYSQLQKEDPTYWQHQMRMLFSQYDEDGNGYLDVKELKSLLHAESQEIQQVLADVDKDKDGMINYQDFCNLVHSYSYYERKA